MPNIAFIPARCGSKSIPLKNIRDFCGKPLIYWATKQLQECCLIDEIVVSTDCDEVAKVVNGFNFSKVTIYRRDDENATDTASTESALIEYLYQKKPEEKSLVFLVQLTSPFTQSDDFKKALNQLQKSGADSLLAGTKFKRFLWNSSGEAVNYDYQSRPRRQDFDGYLLENGAFYINSVKNILRDKNRLTGRIELYEMAEYTSLELDEEDDWMLGEFIMKQKGLNKIINKRPKLCLTDNDGVLTDGGIYYTENGEAMLRFSRIDGKGFELLRKAGIKTGLITSEKTSLIDIRASKLKLDYLKTGVVNKFEMVNQICEELNIGIEEVAYIGDDINDLEVLKMTGLAACPSNAVSAIKNIPGIIELKNRGGNGAFREFTDLILSHP